MQPVSASDIPSKAGGEIPCPLSKDEIYRIVKKYGEVAKRAQIAGFDTVEIHGGHSYMAKAVKERFGKPCVTMGNIRDPHIAEDILAKGDADLIGIGRGLIADPDWVNKVEFGDVCDIRKFLKMMTLLRLSISATA